MAVELNTSHWITVRDITATAYSGDADWLATNDVANAVASGTALILATQNVGKLAVVVTTLDAAGKPPAGFLATVATVEILEVARVVGSADGAASRGVNRRLAQVDTSTDLASGTGGLSKTTDVLSRGEYVIRLATVAAIPGASTRVIVQAKII